MKQLYGKLWVKCTAIVLLIMFAVLLAASALGIAYLISCGAYLDGGAQLRQDAANSVMYRISYSDAQEALQAYRSDQPQELKLILPTSPTYILSGSTRRPANRCCGSEVPTQSRFRAAITARTGSIPACPSPATTRPMNCISTSAIRFRRTTARITRSNGRTG